MASTIDIPPTVPEVSPEQLKIMKIKHSNLLDHGYRSEPASPTREYASLDSSLHGNGHSHGMSSSSSLMRRSSSRHVSSTRRASSFVHSHRSQMSMELSSKAESKFFALMNLMSTASREASALKETWSLIASDRETLARENEELSRRVEEITEVYERKEKEYHHHGNELAERKRQVEKLLLELKAALTEVTTYKKKVSDRDSELERVRLEIVQLRDVQSSRHTDYEKTKKELEATLVQLRAAEEDRDNARHDSHKHHGELRALMREHSELKAKLVESHSKLESSRKEVLSLTDRVKIWELERDEHLHEKDRLQEEIKRVKVRAETSYREFTELTERHERSTREHNKLKEYLRTLETERDDYAVQIDNFRREVKTKTTECEESEARVSEITLKYEHIKREVVSVKEKLRDIEVERTDLRSTIERVQEEYRLCILERDQLKEDLEDERRKHADAHRQITVIKESLRRSELTITEIRSEMHTLTERNKVLIREADDFRHKHGHHSSELSTLREQLALAQAEIRTLIESRDRACHELSDWKSKYEHVTSTYSEYESGSDELEMEIHNLRAMLRDVREQKERAISARHAADRERDEYIAKYEEKCRELERWEDNNSAHFHYSSNGGGRKTFSRTFSSGTTIRNGNGEATRNGESMSVNEGTGIFNSQ